MTLAAFPTTVLATAALPLASSPEYTLPLASSPEYTLPLASSPEYTLPFVGPGTYLIFGIVLLPIYIMLAAWLLGEPSDRSAGLLGVGYLAGLTTALWGGFFVLTMVIKLLFF